MIGNSASVSDRCCGDRPRQSLSLLPGTLLLLALRLVAPWLGTAGTASAEDPSPPAAASLPDFSFDVSDRVVEAEVWDNPLFYDADILFADPLGGGAHDADDLSGDAAYWYAWLEFLPGSGDSVWIGRRQGAIWLERRKLQLPAGEYAAPTLTADRTGQIWLTYEARVDDQWDLFALPLNSAADRLHPRQVSDSSGSDIRHRTCAAREGFWIVWQSDSHGQFEIVARQIGKQAWGPIMPISSGRPGAWHPGVAVTTSDRVCVAWDAYENGSYQVLLRCFENGKWNPPLAIASRPGFEGRVDLQADRSDRIWLAWEEGGENWGQPFRGIQTDAVHDLLGPLHRFRQLRFAVVDASGAMHQLRDPLPMPSVAMARQRAERPDGVSQLGAFYERARLAFDKAGRLWVVYRHYYAPWLGVAHRSHIEAGWGVYARCYGALGWSELVRFDVGQGDGMQRLEVAPAQDGIAAVWTTGRTQRTPSQRARGVAAVLLRAALLRAASPKAALPEAASHSIDQTAPYLLPLKRSTSPLEPPLAIPLAATAPPTESVAGKRYHLHFGDLHRHTDLSLCRVPLDGTIDDAYRYAIDVARLDFLGITDHSRDIAEGNPLSQLWWRSRKEVYRHQLGDRQAMRFIPFYAYERSHSHTADHNVISLRPDMLRPHKYPVPTFWQELNTDTITIPHQPIRRDTWKYHSDALRPLVEIFQGCRDTSIEAEVHDGLAHGYHLGFIASSDHMSTSASYAGVWAEARQRGSVFRALQARRTYAATARIRLVVLARRQNGDHGDHWMGEILAAGDQPLQLTLSAVGTAPIRTIELIIDGQIEKTYAPTGVEAQLTAAINPLGKRYAYFHVLQRDGNQAWSSPIWFDGLPTSLDRGKP